VSQKRKLAEKIRGNPKSVSFQEACAMASYLGFPLHRISGSHHIFARRGEKRNLNFQRKKDGKIPVYQARQLIEMIDEYESEIE
jgi:predicted RNA binding protein YcfA (HicA-like mRNA interferase family)